ncbi:LysR family transcriptional regulator [Ramlibacter sp. Leaf400]|uniref:LysR family transcriptional regulator n=1 Tax=Ramlibacter sp. Leaf400 TaxID=1736365 RepID=UPI000700910B|nr:LysR family transcriptional regulator [Ramlibacter sp. Leaf400]KQT11327.1 LysR family transcriptional regulator [Ramlibacter sp. Leaf400]
MVNLNRFDLVTLRLLVAVIDAGSLTAGADRFGISLAAASKRISELEQHCGVTLLQRSQRGVTATAAGQTVHRHAIEVIARLEQLAQAVDDLQSGAAGHLRLCANPSALGGFLPGLLARYAERYPSVRIDLEDTLSEDGVRAVQSGAAELAVVGDNVPHEGLETFVCDVDELVLLAPQGHPLAGLSSVPMEQALSFDLVALARSASLTRRVISAAEAAGKTVRIRVQVRSFDSMCRMVARGLGIAILPRAAAALYADALGLSVAPLAGADVQRRLLLAMRQRSQLAPSALALVEMIEAGRGSSM